MWIFTPIGGYSVVNRHRDMLTPSPSGEVVVRSRSYQDLRNLIKVAKKWKIESIGNAELVSTPDNEYCCRIFVAMEDWQNALVRLSNISYSNFKNEAHRVNGDESFYANFVLPNIWSTWRGAGDRIAFDQRKAERVPECWPPSQDLKAVSP